MNLKKCLMLLVLFMFNITYVLAQEKTISGIVTDSSGLPLIGVNITVKGTTTGAQTDFDGNYNINADVGDVLAFSYVGLKTIEQTVGASSTVNVTMEEDASVLDEVVITAQGIKREAKAIGYAVATIESSQIESKPETDVAKILSGKVAGVEVNSGGGFLGTSTNVIIRSKNSISGDNQPLYIIDGAPISGDRSYDLDPNNISSLTVLKGLAASTLYGEDGRNGVIVITTKTGAGGEVNKKFEITVSSTTAFLSVGNLPDYQNIYGQGSDNNINTTFFGNWGAAFNGQIVPHHLSIAAYADSYPEFQGATVEYKAVPDNVNDFFNTGIGQISSVLVNKNDGEGNGFSFAFGHVDQQGYIPENSLKRYNLSFGGRTKLSNNFSMNTSVLYNNTVTKRPTRNFFQLVTWIPRNLDIHNLPFQDPNDGSNVYYRTTIQNPKWTQKNTQFKETTDRIFLKADFKYDFNDNLNLSYLYSLDNYNEVNEDATNKGGPIIPNGFLRTFNDNERVTNHRISLVGSNYKLSENLGFNFVLGSEVKNEINKVFGIFSEDQVVFDFLNHSNFREHSPFDFESEINTIGVYGQLEFDYNKYAYLTLSGRNDWASTTEQDNRTIFYPSASLSLIPTSMFPSLKGAHNNYLKVRASYGTSANFPNPYLTRATLNANANAYLNPFTGSIVSINSLNTFLPNPDLKPELLKEFEIGFEGRFFSNKVKFDISLYQRIVEDQILSSSLAASTGFTSTVINAGRIDTEGLEVGLILTPISTENFTWEMNNQFTAYETTVIDLPVERVNIASGLNFAIEDEAYGVIRGTYAVKDDAGNLLINPDTGKILDSDDLGLEDKIVGDPNEDWRWTNINTFAYKGIQLSVQLDYIHGGDIWSNTAANLIRRGVSKDTDSREGSFIIPGVLGDPNTGLALLDGNGDKIKNTIQINTNDLYFINLQDVDENIVYDATVIRLRDVSLSYSFPESFLDKTPFGSIIITASGNNLWWDAPNMPEHLNIDPEVISSGTGNGKGLDFNNDPSYKQYSFGVKLTF